MKKILLLEDEETLGKMYEKKLAQEKYKVCYVQKPQDVVSRAKSFKPDVCFIDLGMKGENVSGLDLVPVLKKLLPKARIIMLSNYTESDMAGKAKAAGASDYLVKIDTSPKVLIEYLKKLA